jgi:peptidoglycan/LPS O-acetylase OafA/YrhL
MTTDSPRFCHPELDILRFGALRTTAAFLLTLVLALIPYRWLETPFLRLKDRFSHLQPAPIEHPS